jgi:hypothetical protein
MFSRIVGFVALVAVCFAVQTASAIWPFPPHPKPVPAPVPACGPVVPVCAPAACSPVPAIPAPPACAPAACTPAACGCGCETATATAERRHPVRKLLSRLRIFKHLRCG